MSINNVPIIGKVLGMLSLFAILAIGLSLLSAHEMRAIDDGYSAAVEHEGAIALHLAQANRALSDVRGSIAELVIADSDEANLKALDGMKQARALFTQRTSEARNADATDRFKVDEIVRAARESIDEICSKTISLAQATGAEAEQAARVQFRTVCDPAFKDLNARFASTAERAATAQKQVDDDLKSATERTILLTYCIIACGLILVGLVAWTALRRWISQPLNGASITAVAE